MIETLDEHRNPTEGFTPGKFEHKMGLHGSPTSAISFDNFRVPPRTCWGR